MIFFPVIIKAFLISVHILFYRKTKNFTNNSLACSSTFTRYLARTSAPRPAILKSTTIHVQLINVTKATSKWEIISNELHDEIDYLLTLLVFNCNRKKDSQKKHVKIKHPEFFNNYYDSVAHSSDIDTQADYD